MIFAPSSTTQSLPNLIAALGERTLIVALG
jgi:hypothetical protein